MEAENALLYRAYDQHMDVGGKRPLPDVLVPRRPADRPRRTDRPVFLYLVTTPFDDDFHAVLQRYGDLLGALPRWTVRLLFPRHLGRGTGAYQVAFRDELATPLSPRILDELRRYFVQLRLAVTNRPDRTRHPPALSCAPARIFSEEKSWQVGVM